MKYKLQMILNLFLFCLYCIPVLLKIGFYWLVEKAKHALVIGG